MNAHATIASELSPTIRIQDPSWRAAVSAILAPLLPRMQREGLSLRELYPHSLTQRLLMLESNSRALERISPGTLLDALPPAFHYALHRPLPGTQGTVLSTAQTYTQTGYTTERLQVLVLIGAAQSSHNVSEELLALTGLISALKPQTQWLFVADRASAARHARTLSQSCKRQLGQQCEWLIHDSETHPELSFAALGKADAAVSFASDLWVDALACDLPVLIKGYSDALTSTLNECFLSGWQEVQSHPSRHRAVVHAAQMDMIDSPTIQRTQQVIVPNSQNALLCTVSHNLGLDTKQIDSLLNHEDQPIVSAKTLPAILRMAERHRRPHWNSTVRKVRKFGRSPRRFVADSRWVRRFSGD